VKPIDVDQLKAIAEIEFADLVLEAFIPDMNRLRIILLDGSVIDVWFSLKCRNDTAIIGSDVVLTERFIATTTLHIESGNL